MKLFIIAKNNIKKAKAATLTLVALVAFATIFLYVGSSVLTQIGNFIDDKNNQMNGAHVISITSRDYKEDIQNIYKEIDGFSYMEQEDAMLYMSSKFQNIDTQEKKYAISSVILDYDTNRTISQVKIIDESKEIYENGIIVPYVLKVANGYHTGDTFNLYIDDKTFEFKIAGFYEDVMFANPTNLTMYKLFVGDKQFDELEKTSIGINCNVNVTILKDIHNANDFENIFLAKIKSELSDASIVYITSNYVTLKTGASVFVKIIMSILIAFSAIILLISLIVIRFSTTTHIENNIKNIGAMEASGYTPRQLIAAILLEYGIIGMEGYVLGIIISIIITPFVTQIVSAAVGLNWRAQPDIKAAAISFAITMLLVLIISYISASKIRRITPLTALRSGIETHNFKKNLIPLDKTKLNVNIAIGMKEFIYNRRQNMVAGIIVMMLSLVCVFALSMYYNFVIDSSPMMRLVGLQDAEVQIVMPNDTVTIYDEVSNMPEVKKILKLESLDAVIKYNGKISNTNFKVTDAYSELQVKTCVKGRMPEHDNEIAMTRLILDEIGVKIGDTISMEYNDVSVEYLVVGITQHISFLGKGAEITTTGMQKLDDGYEGKTAIIYLNEKEDTSEFITKLSNQYKDQGIQVVNNKESLEKMLESFSSSIRIISFGCMIITAIIIVFILFLIVRARLLRERMRLGVSKALGYTSNQLMGHILISQTPVIVVSSVIGAIAGLYLTNPIMALALASNGIMHCNFFVDIRFIVFTPIGISVIGFITVIAVSMGIKKISPSKMFEQAKN